MEKALALDSYDIKSLSEKGLAGYDALALGSEFCARLLPAPGETQALRAVFKGRLILATPMLTEADLSDVKKLLKLLAGKKTQLEVIVNDLGLLEVLRSGFKGKVKVSCGRILSHRVKIMPEAYVRKFLKRYGIARFEVDEPKTIRRLAPYGLPFSWHYPFRYVTVTRFCPWEEHWAESCAHSCRGRAEPLTSIRVHKTLWLKGCAYFTRGQRPKGSASRNIFEGV